MLKEQKKHFWQNIPNVLSGKWIRLSHETSSLSGSKTGCKRGRRNSFWNGTSRWLTITADAFNFKNPDHLKNLEHFSVPPM